MSVGSRIKELRESKNISRNELADSVGVTVGAISNYENEVSSPKEPILFKIMEFLKCDANYLFQDAVEMPSMKNSVSIEELHLVEKYRDLDSYGKEIVDIILEKERNRVLSEKDHAETTPIRLINYYYRLASAGTGQILFDMPPTKKIEIPAIPEYRKVDYALGVNGDSMNPTYHDGDTLLVEMTEELNIGEIGIFSVDSECYVKKLGKNELISLNPAYANIPLNETAKCMGKVIAKLERV